MAIRLAIHEWLMDDDAASSDIVDHIGGLDLTLMAASDDAERDTNLQSVTGPGGRYPKAISTGDLAVEAYYMESQDTDTGIGGYSAFSFRSWFKYTGDLDSSADFGTIMGQTAPNFLWSLRYRPQWSRFYYQITTENGLLSAEFDFPDDRIEDDDWHCAIATYDGAGLNLFIDGSLVDGPEAVTGDTSSDVTVPFRVGIYNPPTTQDFPMHVAAVGVCDYEMSAEEIAWFSDYTDMGGIFVPNYYQQLMQ